MEEIENDFLLLVANIFLQIGPKLPWSKGKPPPIDFARGLELAGTDNTVFIFKKFVDFFRIAEDSDGFNNDSLDSAFLVL